MLILIVSFTDDITYITMSVAKNPVFASEFIQCTSGLLVELVTRPTVSVIIVTMCANMISVKIGQWFTMTMSVNWVDGSSRRFCIVYDVTLRPVSRRDVTLL